MAMASVVVGESEFSEKEKKVKNAEAPDIVEDSNSAKIKIKIGKKSNKNTKLTSEPDPDGSNNRKEK